MILKYEKRKDKNGEDIWHAILEDSLGQYERAQGKSKSEALSRLNFKLSQKGKSR